MACMMCWPLVIFPTGGVISFSMCTSIMSVKLFRSWTGFVAHRTCNWTVSMNLHMPCKALVLGEPFITKLTSERFYFTVYIHVLREFYLEMKSFGTLSAKKCRCCMFDLMLISGVVWSVQFATDGAQEHVIRVLLVDVNVQRCLTFLRQLQQGQQLQQRQICGPLRQSPPIWHCFFGCTLLETTVLCVGTAGWVARNSAADRSRFCLASSVCLAAFIFFWTGSSTKHSTFAGSFTLMSSCMSWTVSSSMGTSAHNSSFFKSPGMDVCVCEGIFPCCPWETIHWWYLSVHPVCTVSVNSRLPWKTIPKHDDFKCLSLHVLYAPLLKKTPTWIWYILHSTVMATKSMGTPGVVIWSI